MIVDASHAPEPVPVKSLAERVAYDNPKSKKSEPLTKTSANPKAQPKSATATKADSKDKKKAGKGKPVKKARNPRPKPKTAEELDAEMTDYWNGGAGNTATAEVAAANGAVAGDAMEEISVSEESARLASHALTQAVIATLRRTFPTIALIALCENETRFNTINCKCINTSTTFLGINPESLRIAWSMGGVAGLERPKRNKSHNCHIKSHNHR